MAFGLVLVSVFMEYPVFRALSGASEITVLQKLAMGSIAVLALGVVVFLNISFLEDQQNLKLRDFIIMGVLAIAGIGAYVAFKAYIESQGYAFPPL